MGRAGIQFSEVKRAAEAIQATGNTVTAARVRAAIGSGSMSTIGRYLQEWKRGRKDGDPSDADRLEDDLMDAMHQVYTRLHTRANIELERERAEHSQRMAEAQARLGEAAQLQADAQRAVTSANNEVERVRLELSASQALAQERLMENRSLVAAAEATAQTLADRAAEIHELRKLVEQGRAQFDHYTNATNAKMKADAEAHQKQIANVETALRAEQAKRREEGEARTRLETELNFERAAHGATRQELNAVRSAEQAAQAALALSKGVSTQLEQQLAEKRAQIDALRAQVDAQSQDANALQIGLAGRDSLVTQLREQLASTEARLDRFLQYNPERCETPDDQGAAPAAAAEDTPAEGAHRQASRNR